MPVADDEPLRDFPDRALRQLLPYPQHLRSLLRRVLPALADGFDYDRARLLEREFPLDDCRRRESDLLFLIPYRTAAEERWALVCGGNRCQFVTGAACCRQQCSLCALGIELQAEMLYHQET